MNNRIITLALACLILTASSASAADRKQYFSVGYDFYTIMKAVDAKSAGIGYEQNSAGLTLGWSFELDSEDLIVLEYRDAGVGEIACNEVNATVEVDGSTYFCSTAGFVMEPEASSWSVAYKFSNPGKTEYKVGLGMSSIVYPNTIIPDNENTGLYIGWEIPVDRKYDGSGLYLDFGAVLGQTFGIGLKYQFATD